MYGSSLMRVTLRPRDSRIAAREAAAIPLPREETTPPVTNTYFVIVSALSRAVQGSGVTGKAAVYRPVFDADAPSVAAIHSIATPRAIRTRRARSGKSVM